ncbi:dehydrogenase [Micractinium conductrix]|uniref:Dehydrogenase n=1 Tax=Micractinium conductrix TaxID=554055 RepID=A0A2P6VMF3_9CHLO|nr:dehydrogenase [Micractinium conductrix]|eukprot:PSC75278.1 dehydrogenase [Micractinium conductrix]
MAGLSGRSALITGAAKGIGFACAQALGGAGVCVLLADVDAPALAAAERQLRDAGVQAATAVCDVGDKAQVEAAVAAAVKAFGSLDLAVCNAGIVRGADFLEMSEEDFDCVIRVNLKGVFLTGQAAARQMVAQGRGGAIVTMSSVNGIKAIPTIAGYNASKGGVDNLTRCMALSLAPHNIRVNAVGPGSILTDVLAAVVSDKAAMGRVLSRTPMLRVAEPIEVGNVVKFLLSDDASYITGQVLYVDGGRMALNYTVPVPEQE